MNRLKALGILTNDNIFDERYISENEYYKKEIEEAIKELEELENRSCNTCKSNFCSIKRILIREDEINSNYFYCNDWENKA